LKEKVVFSALTNTVGGGEGGGIKYLTEQAFPLLPPYSSHFFPFKLSLIDSFLLHYHCPDLLQYSSNSLSLSQFTTVFLQLSLSQGFFQLNVIVTIYYSIFLAHCHSYSLLQCSSSSLSLSECTISPSHCHCHNLL
jgi:hypothetical protein